MDEWAKPFSLGLLNQIYYLAERDLIHILQKGINTYFTND